MVSLLRHTYPGLEELKPWLSLDTIMPHLYAKIETVY